LRREFERNGLPHLPVTKKKSHSYKQQQKYSRYAQITIGYALLQTSFRSSQIKNGPCLLEQAQKMYSVSQLTYSNAFFTECIYTCEGVAVQLHTSLTSALNVDEWSGSRPQQLQTHEKTSRHPLDRILGQPSGKCRKGSYEKNHLSLPEMNSSRQTQDLVNILYPREYEKLQRTHLAIPFFFHMRSVSLIASTYQEPTLRHTRSAQRKILSPKI
jgi:hypothetical protein